MLTKDHLVASGAMLFRWRSFVLTAFFPAMAIAISQGHWVEITFGDTTGQLVEWLALALIGLGLGIRIHTVGHVPARTSGRNTRGQVADTLNTTGLYAVVRNPLYLGNAIAYLGAAVYTQSPILPVLLALVLALYFERIIAAEETFLVTQFGTHYTGWAARTPAFFPAFRLWQRPAMPFSWRSVIAREHPTWAGAVVMLYLIEMATSYVEGAPMLDRPLWHAALACAVVGQSALLLIKRKSTLLQVAGR
ncbi:methyltransferase family protein [Roseicyclus sp.]|uniref:methyltransferase family protein n=1 Tax=Roseicyclus sp. TaxID=1914329 RepID=UPI003F6B7C73